MTLEEIIRPTFGGHEKFVFRHGWLKKGVDAVIANEMAFIHEEALAKLGVGKNMVRSIRHWCIAMSLIYEKDRAGVARPLATTLLGKKLLSNAGWDPYLENIASLWLLHWQLTTNLTRGFIWYLLFTVYREPEFTLYSSKNHIKAQIEQRNIKTTDGAIEREIEYCLRTYIPSRSKLGIISEETLDCPLAELDIIKFITKDNVYRFNIGPKVSLPLEVFGFSLLNFFAGVVKNRHTVLVDEVLYQPGSPGQVFKLDENSIVEYLEMLENLTQGKIRLQESTGTTQIYLDESLENNYQNQAIELLKGYYEQ